MSCCHGCVSVGSRGRYSACGKTWRLPFKPIRYSFSLVECKKSCEENRQRENQKKRLELMWLRLVCYITCGPTHLCLSCNSLYSSSRITTPARVSRSMATLTSKLQHVFPAGPGELQGFGGCGVWRGPSIPCLALMMAWTRTGWSVSRRIRCGFLSIGWGGIWREVRLVTWWPNFIAARFDPTEKTGGV